MDAVDPHIHVVAVGQVPLTEPPVVFLPDRREACDVGRTEARRVIAQQHRQRLVKIPRRQPPQIEDRPHLGDRGRTTPIRGQDPTREALALTVRGHALVVHPRRGDLQRAGPAGHVSRPGSAVADDQPTPLLVAFLAVRVDVLCDLDRQPAISIRRAPSRASSSSVGAAGASGNAALSARSLSSTFSLGGVSCSRPASRSIRVVSRGRIRHLLHAADPQLLVISPLRLHAVSGR